MADTTLELLARQLPVEKRYATALQRTYTISGYVHNFLRPWQPFVDPITHEVIEQDFVGYPAITDKGEPTGNSYTTGFTPWSDVLGGIGYLTAFPLGLVSGIEFNAGEKAYVDEVSSHLTSETINRLVRISKYGDEEKYLKQLETDIGYLPF